MQYIKLIILTFMLLIGFGSLSGQNSASEIYLNAGSDDFETIRQTMDQYFVNREKGQGSGYKQWKRWEYFMERRLTPDGKVTNWALRNWEAYNEFSAQQAKSAGDNPDVTFGDWNGLGPIGYTLGAGWNGGVGRINCIAFHPTLENTFWVGAPAGGLWKTTDGGSSWMALTDGMPVIGVSGIAVDHTNTNVLYILTGDGDGGHTRSIGVLKSSDGGETWRTTGFTYDIYSNLRGYKLLMHPTNPGILFVVCNYGIYRTDDGGVSWIKKEYGSFQDIEFKPGDPAIIYATAGGNFCRSTNTGDTWTWIYEGLPFNASRMAIGVSPAAPGFVYLFAGPATGNGQFVGLFWSNNSGNNFTTQCTMPNLLGYDINGYDNGHQTTYDLAMAVDPASINRVFVGGINVWRSQLAGSTGSWLNSSMWDYTGTGYTHADIHGLDFNPLNRYLYCMSDGGIFRSTDGGWEWTDLTAGIANTQWYRIAGTPNNANLIVGGTQDNGCNKWTGGLTMEHMRGADGMDCMIDYNNNNIIYTTRQNGALEKSMDGGATFSWKYPPGYWGAWVTPLVMNPTNPLIIYGGYINSVYKSIDGGDTWTDKGIGGCSAMAIGTNSPNCIYAAMDTGRTTVIRNLWRSVNGGDTWTPIRTGLPAITITGIAVDPDNFLNIFVTFAGYSAGEKVYHSINGGYSWTNFSGNLPNVAVNCIAFKDNNGSPANAVYAGTDIGVFYRDNNHADWIPFRNGMPVVPVLDLEINHNNGVITAGTFGRGLWRSDLYSSCPADYTLTAGNDPGNPNYTGFQYYEAGNSLNSSRTITGGLGTDVTYQANSYIVLTSGFHAKENNLFQAKLGPCGLGASMLNRSLKVHGIFIGKLKD